MASWGHGPFGPPKSAYVVDTAAVAAIADDDADSLLILAVLQVVTFFRTIEKSLRISDLLKQGIKLIIYMLYACHIGACWLHIVACFQHKKYGPT